MKGYILSSDKYRESIVEEFVCTSMEAIERVIADTENDLCFGKRFVKKHGSYERRKKKQ